MNEDPPRIALRRPLVPLLTLLLLAALAATAGAQEKTNNPPAGGSTTGGAGNPPPQGARQSGRLIYGDRAPDFELPTLDGQSIELRDFRGHAAVVLLFAERPDAVAEGYRQVAESLRAEGAWLVVVTHQRLVRGAPGDAGRFVAYDRLGEVARTYGALDVVTNDFVPSVFMVDNRGYVRYFAIGALPSANALLATTRGVMEFPQQAPASAP
jgi:peroxiredoxin